MAAPIAVADPVLPPVTSIPVEVSGAVTATGTASTELSACAAAPEVVALCLGAAGVGGYQAGNAIAHTLWGGTCDADEFCSTIGNAVLNVTSLFGYDPRGDLRTVTYTGPNAVVTCNSGCGGVPSVSTPASFTVFATQASGVGFAQDCAVVSTGVSSLSRATVGFGLGAFSTALSPVVVDGTRSSATGWGTLMQGSVTYASGDAAGSTCPAGYVPSAVRIVRDTTVQASFTFDLHAGAAWTVTYTETCRKGGATVTASRTVTYTPTASGAAPVPTDMPTCSSILPGSHLDNLTVTGGRGGATELTVGVPTFAPAATSSYPACTSNVDPLHPCHLYVWVNGKNCETTGVYCAQWTAKPDAQLSCTWGPYDMAISVCRNPANGLATRYDTELEPDPNATPTVAPGGAVFPTSGTNPDENEVGTGTEAGNGAAPGALPSTGGSCMGGIVSWNPVNWVLTPVKCALKWAFVPSAWPNFADIASPLPSGWVPTFPALSDGECGAVVMPSLNLGSMVPSSGAAPLFNTCDAGWATARTFSYYGLLAVGLIGIGWRGFRAVLGGLGMQAETVTTGGGDDD